MGEADSGRQCGAASEVRAAGHGCAPGLARDDGGLPALTSSSARSFMTSRRWDDWCGGCESTGRPVRRKRFTPVPRL